MAGLEELASIIYHEKQQSGSMLCAQHALNSLLQGAYFTAPDLSEIARKLDGLEEQYNTEDRRGGSRNMDDTGFFSIQVMEEAIAVWGLSLVRWRSNVMRPYQGHPHTQLAFILNFEQHWFTLRRFGPASANLDQDAGEGHWFNLNSFLSAPEWVGKLYLGMVLQQAEAEGYSVFAVTQDDPSRPLALPRTEADDVAATLPEPQSASQSSVYNATKRASDISGSTKTSTREGPSEAPMRNNEIEGVEDEDLELQAALQASLSNQEDYRFHLHDDGYTNPPILPPPLETGIPSRSYSGAMASGSTSTTGGRQFSRQLSDAPEHADLDPVAASMERNRVLLQRMREHQEFAQRELWSSNGLTPEQQAVEDERRKERLREEEEETEQLKKAIAESEAMAREHRERQKSSFGQREAESVDANLVTPAGAFDLPTLERRNYDDDDADLQAALRASLENIPDEWRYTDTPQPSAPKHSEHQDRGKRNASNDNIPESMDVDEDEEWHSESEASDRGGTTSSKVTTRPQVTPNLDEMRKARLARFGS